MSLNNFYIGNKTTEKRKEKSDIITRDTKRKLEFNACNFLACLAMSVTEFYSDAKCIQDAEYQVLLQVLLTIYFKCFLIKMSISYFQLIFSVNKS